MPIFPWLTRRAKCLVDAGEEGTVVCKQWWQKYSGRKDDLEAQVSNFVLKTVDESVQSCQRLNLV